MANTKYLYNPEKQTYDGMVSVSQIQSFLSCPKKWEYGYKEGITPRVERPFLSIGKLCHRGMQVAMQYKWEHEREQHYCREDALRVALIEMDIEHKNYMESNSFLAEELPDIEQILKDATRVFTQAFWEFDIDKYEVLTLRQNGKSIPALELHFAIPCAGSKGLHGYIDAILRNKITGCLWCTDYKFRKTLAPDEDEAFNIQNAVYARACQKMGIGITGTMTWQHLNTPAADPAILKNGQISRAKIKTTWPHYRAFCLSHGQDPKDYCEEMIEKLSDIEWYRATYEYRNTATINAIWNDCVVPASRAIAKATREEKPKSRSLYPWNCKMCQFQSLCQGELRGYDTEAIRLREYTQRHHRRTEDNPETPNE